MTRIDTTLEEMKVEDSDWNFVFEYASNTGYGAEGTSINKIDNENVSTDWFSLKDVDKIIASYEGENDGPDWLAVGQLKDKRYFFISAECDYTGWE